MPRVNIASLAASFPEGILPEPLFKLCAFQESNEFYSYSGEFIVDNDAPESIEDLPLRDSFGGIGSDATGSVFAFWSGSNEPLSRHTVLESPIVFLDSEAVNSTVVCSRFSEFICLLLLDLDDLGEQAGRDALIKKTPLKMDGQAFLFRKWAKTSFGLDPPCAPSEIVQNAKRLHQDAFFSWYKLWQQDEPWTRKIE